MNAQDVALHKFLHGAKQFVIPIFQRTYDWGTHHCEQLWNDIVRVGSTETQGGHFIGSVVCVMDPAKANVNIPNWMIIDGQQRLTTVTLFLIAICRVLKEQPGGKFRLTDDETISVDQVEDYYLKNRYGQGDLQYRLRLTQRDRDTLSALLEGAELPRNYSEQLVENFEFFQEKIDLENLAVAYAGFQRLIVVDVTLKQGHDDPQMIFESMNSTGLDLSQADLIRNFVLMSQPQAEQIRLYNEYWHPMEEDFGSLYRKEFDTFVRDFLTMRQRLSRPMKANKVYREFKGYCREAKAAGIPIADVLEDMRQLSTYFVHFYSSREHNEHLRGAFQSLRVLTDGATSLVLRLYEFYAAGDLSCDDFVEIVRTLESYLFRRMVCDLPSNSLPQIFAVLTNSIRPDNPVQSVKVLLHRFGKRRRFPTDQEFRAALLTRDIYSMRVRKFLLERLENDSREQIDTKPLTVEHVMPQTEKLNSEWRNALGEDWRNKHATWLHRLGNLTLTGYNSEYSNRGFSEKKTMPRGFNESPLRLNQFIKLQTSWNVNLIEARGKELADDALQLWKPLNVADEVLREFELHKAMEDAQDFSVDDVKGLEDQRLLFDSLSQRIHEIGDDVVELFSEKNVTYRVFDFFVQVMPLTSSINLLLNLDVDEIDDPNEICRDTSQLAFVRNATEDGGVFIRLKNTQSIDEVMEFITIAYENVSD